MSDWITLSSTSGSGSTTITISASSNTEAARRIKSLVVRSGNLSSSVLVSQEKPTFGVTPSEIYFNTDGSVSATSTNQISIYTENDWEAVLPDWMSADITSGTSGTSVMTVSADANTFKSENRQSHINIYSPIGGDSRQVNVIQDFHRPISISGASGTISVSSAGTTGEIYIITDYEWELESDATSDWITVSQSAGTGTTKITYTVEANGTTSDRQGNLYFTTGPNNAGFGIMEEGKEVPTGDYFYFEAIDNPVTIAGYAPLYCNYNFQYSTDKVIWYDWIKENFDYPEITINAGQKLYILGNNESLRYFEFTTSGTGYAKIGGKILSLVSESVMEDGSFPSDSDFGAMFAGNTNLKSAEDLILADYGGLYKYMFYGCTSLTTAPALLEESPGSSAYFKMFNGCSSLNYIKALFKTKGVDSTTNWVKGVASSGTFVKSSGESVYDIGIGVDGIPEGWVIESITSAETNVFYLEAVGGDITIYGRGDANINLRYSFDKYEYNMSNWNTWNYDGKYHVYDNITIPQGQKLYILGSNGELSNFHFIVDDADDDAYLNTGGSILSLLSPISMINGTVGEVGYKPNFKGLFSGTTILKYADELVLPKNVNDYAYKSMFEGCTSLVSVPELPATTMKSFCYWNMFNGCSSLVNAPELPATTLASNCYSGMFGYCSSLVTAPVLPATTLVTCCYAGMFQGCTSLNYIKALFTEIGDNSLFAWADSVSSTGTFVKNSAISEDTIGRSGGGIPEGWTVEDA